MGLPNRLFFLLLVFARSILCNPFLSPSPDLPRSKSIIHCCRYGWKGSTEQRCSLHVCNFKGWINQKAALMVPFSSVLLSFFPNPLTLAQSFSLSRCFFLGMSFHEGSPLNLVTLFFSTPLKMMLLLWLLQEGKESRTTPTYGMESCFSGLLQPGRLSMYSEKGFSPYFSLLFCSSLSVLAAGEQISGIFLLKKNLCGLWHLLGFSSPVSEKIFTIFSLLPLDWETCSFR